MKSKKVFKSIIEVDKIVRECFTIGYSFKAFEHNDAVSAKKYYDKEATRMTDKILSVIDQGNKEE